LHRGKAFPRTGKLGREPCELFEVESGQRFEPFGTIAGEMEPDNAMVFFVSGPADEAGGVGTVDEADGAVME
jgi:hypothetical protein